jgi:hypothetical protein
MDDPLAATLVPDATYYVPLKWCSLATEFTTLVPGAVLKSHGDRGIVGFREASLALGRGALSYTPGDPVVLGSFADAASVATEDTVYVWASSVRVIRVLGPEERTPPRGELYISSTSMCFPRRRGTELPYAVRTCPPRRDGDVCTRILVWTRPDFSLTREMVLGIREDPCMHPLTLISDVTKPSLFPVQPRPLASFAK